MKDCSFCKYYKYHQKICGIENQYIRHTNLAEYCWKYEKAIQCKNCINLNKYRFCNQKKQCFTEEQIIETKKCSSYKSRKQNKRKN